MSDMRRVGLCDDDNVERRRQRQAPLSEYLPDEPLDSVPHHGVPHPRADRHAQTRDRRVTRGLHDDEARRMSTPPVTLQGQELPPPPHPGGLGIPSGAGHGSVMSSPGLLRGDGYGQALPPLGAATLEHLTPGGRRHARTESMGALSPSIARLIRPLHWKRHPKPRPRGKVKVLARERRSSRAPSRASRSWFAAEDVVVEPARFMPTGTLRAIGRLSDRLDVSPARVSAAALPGPRPPATGPFPRRALRTSGP